MDKHSITIWYGRAEPGYVYRYKLTVAGRYDLADEFDLEQLAEKAASDYHSNRDGWESSWPITFYIAATEDGDELARFEIERDVEPVFSARAVAKATGGAAPAKEEK